MFTLSPSVVLLSAEMSDASINPSSAATLASHLAK